MDTQIMEILGQYGITGIALYFVTRTLWNYIQKIDKKQEQREIQQRQDYKEMEERYIQREEKYIKILNKFGNELEGIKISINEIKGVIKNANSKESD